MYIDAEMKVAKEKQANGFEWSYWKQISIYVCFVSKS